MYDVVIIGGGLTGITIGRELLTNGINNILMVDKSNSVGGRMATRRIGVGRADHGAQFFTVRSKEFGAHIDTWKKQGLINKWFGNDHTRYMAISGMNSLAKHLSINIPTKLQYKVSKIEYKDDHYVVSDGTESIKTKKIVVTAPVPQTTELLRNSQVNVPVELENISFAPCIVGLVELNNESKLPVSGHLDDPTMLDDAIVRLADQQKKGISNTSIISVYMTTQWSQQHYEESDEGVASTMIGKCAKYFRPDDVQSIQIKRWRYAEAMTPIYQPFVKDDGLYIGGDAFLQPNDTAKRTRLESAFLSGLAIAEDIVKG
ncbi:hypothetical protein EJF36_03620 [Bacillus sp. HMF5848]|uniref:NAD(P)/FAD-dependent oxidoreductase n=1 Tax=Bacillus sp. HMF5848 TaxID=2495421 RepID=UPI000F7840CC|nr:FAD-dependent oxidoreductase [Bacillus sp. HMF5848]RSK26034.1 hypothetical protein EJF36_03620 [Bacillus sp. HMF5848]